MNRSDSTGNNVIYVDHTTTSAAIGYTSSSASPESVVSIIRDQAFIYPPPTEEQTEDDKDLLERGERLGEHK